MYGSMPGSHACGLLLQFDFGETVCCASTVRLVSERGCAGVLVLQLPEVLLAAGKGAATCGRGRHW